LFGVGTAAVASRDILVVGGGPAGLAAAIAARRRGFRVTVTDGAVLPIDKACGEGLMPDALEALAKLGVQLRDEDSFSFRGIRFLDGGCVVEAGFPNGVGRGARRTKLHQAMREYAESIGVEFRWGSPVGVNDLAIGDRWIIGADGGNSAVRKWAGLEERVNERVRYGFRRHYRIAPWSPFVEIYWTREGYQIYITPVAADRVCVAILTGDPHLRVDAALQGVPDVAQRLGGHEIMTTERGSVSASRRLRAVYRDRVALIGDASGSVDAITGQGLCLAFHQAEALAAAMTNGDLVEYQAEHERIARRPQWMAKLLLSLGDHAAFRVAAMRAMAVCPPIFSGLLALHVGAFDEKNRSVSDAGIIGPGAGIDVNATGQTQ
jgi:flavin-dependent dehydrogenase